MIRAQIDAAARQLPRARDDERRRDHEHDADECVDRQSDREMHQQRPENRSHCDVEHDERAEVERQQNRTRAQHRRQDVRQDQDHETAGDERCDEQRERGPAA